jgi:hypothetical protein
MRGFRFPKTLRKQDMRARWPALSLSAALSLLTVSCDLIPKSAPDPSLLASSGSSAPPAGPDCASCHAYPLRDVLHAYHLMSSTVNRDNLGQPELNNITTCMDCHFNSVRHFSFVHSDTVWGDSAGNEIMQHTLPSDKILKITDYPGYRPLGTFAADTNQREGCTTTGRWTWPSRPTT